ncbi:MAG: hypothetical protein ACREQ5_32655, partial [Candidatus Dormibacteria bacterium]
SFGVQSLMASGQKVDKQFLSTFVPNMQYYVSQNLPELRSKIVGTASKTEDTSGQKGNTEDTSGQKGNTFAESMGAHLLGSVGTVGSILAGFGSVVDDVVTLDAATVARVLGHEDYARQLEDNLFNKTIPMQAETVTTLYNTSQDFINKHLTKSEKDAQNQNQIAAQQDDRNPNLDVLDKGINAVKRYIHSPQLIPGQLVESLPTLIVGGAAGKAASATIKDIAEAAAPSITKSVINWLGAESVEKAAAGTAFNAPMVTQALSNIAVSSYNENYNKTKDVQQALHAAKIAIGNPATAMVVAIGLLPIGVGRALAGNLAGFKGFAARTLAQVGQLGTISAGETAAGNIAAGRNPLEQVPAAFGAGAASGFPLALG